VSLDRQASLAVDSLIVLLSLPVWEHNQPVQFHRASSSEKKKNSRIS